MEKGESEKVCVYEKERERERERDRKKERKKERESERDIFTIS